jgi:hypothetical protein
MTALDLQTLTRANLPLPPSNAHNARRFSAVRTADRLLSPNGGLVDMLQVDGAMSPAERQSPLVSAAQRLVVRIETLVDEVAKLRADNASLRREVRAAVALLDTAGTTAANGHQALRGRPASAAKPASGRRRRRGRTAKGRATPAEVTSDVVRAVLVKLGEATASEIAIEITSAGAPVGGRAVRFLAERAGATTRVGEDGQRRYRLG